MVIRRGRFCSRACEATRACLRATPDAGERLERQTLEWLAYSVGVLCRKIDGNLGLLLLGYARWNTRSKGGVSNDRRDPVERVDLATAGACSERVIRCQRSTAGNDPASVDHGRACFSRIKCALIFFRWDLANSQGDCSTTILMSAKSAISMPRLLHVMQFLTLFFAARKTDPTKAAVIAALSVPPPMSRCLGI
jgi:hypothetical protein